MYKTVALVVALITLAPLTSGQTDSIRLLETGGCVIVQLVLERIEKFILPEVYSSSDRAANARDVSSMKEFLRRIAAVESDYGRADHTYRENYHGGIWQVDEADFNHTRTGIIVNLDFHRHVHTAIANRMGVKIDWFDTIIGMDPPKWEDLRRPLYSGLAAMLKLLLTGQNIPDFDNVTGQADFWIRYYHNNNGGRVMTRENFTAVANSRCSVPCQSYPDIVFVVDSSGSVGPFHFQQALNFTANLVPEFRIGPDFTHIGVIIYDHLVIASEQIALNRYFDASELSAAIRGIRYSGGGTATGRAIWYATDTIFDSSNGARNDGRSRVGIVLTDGRSHDDVTGPSDAARNANINLIAIGIGTGIVEDELLAIAGSHEQVYLVETFADLPSFSASIETASCLTAVALELGDTLSAFLMDREVRYLSLTVRPGENYTLQIDVTNGDLVVYGSLVTAMPGPDAYDFKLNITGDLGVITDYLIIVPRLPEEGTQRKRRQTEPDEEMTLVLAFVGVGDNASLELNVTEGDSRRYGDLAVSLTEDENADGTTFYVCEANCTCEQAYVNLTISTTVVELPEGAILNQISNRKAEVILPNNYLGLLHCVIATPGVLGSEVFSTINITGKRFETADCFNQGSFYIVSLHCTEIVILCVYYTL